MWRPGQGPAARRPATQPRAEAPKRAFLSKKMGDRKHSLTNLRLFCKRGFFLLATVKNFNDDRGRRRHARRGRKSLGHYGGPGRTSSSRPYSYRLRRRRKRGLVEQVSHIHARRLRLVVVQRI